MAILKNQITNRKPPSLDTEVAQDGGFTIPVSEYLRTMYFTGDLLYVGGGHTSYKGNTNLSKLTNLDKDWGYITPLTSILSSCNGVIQCIIEASSDEIFVSGNFTSIDGATQNCYTRINRSTGNLNTTFRDGTGNKANATVLKMMDFNGGLYICGTFTTVSGGAALRLSKISYGTGVKDGNFVTSTGANSNVLCMVPDYLSAGVSFYIGGSFTTFQGQSRPRLARVTATTGGCSTVFNGLTLTNSAVWCLEYDQDTNMLFAGGQFTTFNGVDRSYLAKFSRAGTLDTTFDISSKIAGGLPVVRSLKVHGDSIYVGGNFDSYGGVTRKGLIKLNKNTGVLDTAFDVGILDSAAYILELDIREDSLYAVGGGFSTANYGVPVSGLLKLDLGTGALK